MVIRALIVQLFMGCCATMFGLRVFFQPWFGLSCLHLQSGVRVGPVTSYSRLADTSPPGWWSDRRLCRVAPRRAPAVWFSLGAAHTWLVLCLEVIPVPAAFGSDLSRPLVAAVPSRDHIALCVIGLCLTSGVVTCSG